MIEALRKLNQLKKNRIIRDYAIGGAHAVAYYLEPLVTYDLDVFVLLETEHDFYTLRNYLKRSGFKTRGTHTIINDIPVHFLPGTLHPFINEAVKIAKKIRVKTISTKVLTVEYLILSLLMAFRLKDKMAILELMDLADMKKLKSLISRFSDEETPLDQRLQKVLANIR
jgi:hypothetical protein